MLDPVACAQLSEAHEPRISVAALLALRRLLDEHLLCGVRETRTPIGTVVSQGDDYAPNQDSASSHPTDVPIRPE